MEQAEAFTGVELPDGRTLYVGPASVLDALDAGGEPVSGQVHALACVIERWPGDPVTDRTLADGQGNALYDEVSVLEAVEIAPEKAMDIVAAAHALVAASLEAAEMVSGSDAPQDVLLRTYVTDHAAQFARDAKAAAVQLQRALAADLDRELG